jgi:hypothetical protein
VLKRVSTRFRAVYQPSISIDGRCRSNEDHTPTIHLPGAIDHGKRGGVTATERIEIL